MKDRNILYVIADAYPETNSLDFDSYIGAMVGSWICNDLFETQDDLLEVIAKKLKNINWNISQIIQVEKVTSNSYKEEDSGKSFYEQALVDGFVANFNRIEREEMCAGDKDNNQILYKSAYNEFINHIGSGLFSLYSDDDDQWANGVTPNGDDFLPLWKSKTEIEFWEKYWPGYYPQEISVKHLYNDLLDEVSKHDMWVAIGIDSIFLYTMHPISLKRNLKV
jgi:hypothetical protein